MPAPDGLEVLTSANWDAEVLRSALPFVVGFWADWCLPCHMAAPALEEAAGAFRGRLRFGVVDYDGSPDLAARYEVQGLPTIVVFRDGHAVERRVGLMGRASLRHFVEKHLMS